MATPGELVVPSVVRGRLPQGAARSVAARVLLWAGVQGVVAAAATAWIGFSSWTLGISLGLGLVAGHPRALGRALRAGLLLAALVGWIGAMEIQSGTRLLLSGGAGVGSAALGLAAPRDWHRAFQGALAGVAGAGLGAWISNALPIAGLAPPLIAGIGGAVTGLCIAQVLWVSSLVWTRSDRMPSERWIRSTLAEPYRPPCERALALDKAIAPKASDAETRDGLAEVAAWVYRLSWTLQTLDAELAALDPEQLDARIEAARASVNTTDDEATREPRAATLRHLEQLGRHRDALQLERVRNAALVDYALAFLEQARAGLALAAMRPSEGNPERLGEVLTRLRTRATESEARRSTARQLNPLA